MNQAKERILIVDDNSEVLNLFRIVLSVGGYEVHTAKDGVTALEIIREPLNIPVSEGA